jgi:hypothetical protein
MSDIEDLQKKQAALAREAMKMVEEKDGEKIVEMAAAFALKAAEFEKSAINLSKSIEEQSGTSGPGTTVVLTREQRARIEEATGVGMETVTVHDNKARRFSKEMTKVERREIEKEAMNQAAQIALEIKTRDAVQKVLKELRALERPELKEYIDTLTKDPLLPMRKKKK